MTVAKVLVANIFAFAISYTAIWALVHYCCNTSEWSDFVRFTATQIAPLICGCMATLTLNKSSA